MDNKLNVLNSFEKLSDKDEKSVDGGKMNMIGYGIGYAFGSVERIIISTRNPNRW